MNSTVNLTTIERRETVGARQFWSEDAYCGLYIVETYAETARLMIEVDDMGGVRRALERMIAHARLAAAAVRKIEEIDGRKPSCDEASA